MPSRPRRVRGHPAVALRDPHPGLQLPGRRDLSSSTKFLKKSGNSDDFSA